MGIEKDWLLVLKAFPEDNDSGFINLFDLYFK